MSGENKSLLSGWGSGSKKKGTYSEVAGAERAADAAVDTAEKKADQFLGNEEASLDAKAAQLRKEKSLPRTLLQKFLFMLIAAAQTYVVYMVTFGVDFGLPCLRTTGDGLKLQYAMLIVGGFVLSFASFVSTAVLTPGTPLYSTIVLGIDASNASVGTALVGALGSPTWGAEGDIITLLKYLIQYQVFVTYVNVGFTFVFTQPHIEFPDFLTPIVQWFDHLDEHINYCLAPIVAFGGVCLTAICWPFLRLWDIFCFVVGWFTSLFSPFKRYFAWVIVKTGLVFGMIFDYIHMAFTAVYNAVVQVCDAIKTCCISVGEVLSSVWSEYIVHPVIYAWESLVTFAVYIKDQFVACMGKVGESFTPIKHCLDACEKIAELIWVREEEFFTEDLGFLTLRDHHGWVEKQGHWRTNWTTRFFTLKKGTFRYFGKIGDEFPPQGADLKGELELHNYSIGYQMTENPNEVHLPSKFEMGKDYHFRLPNPERAREFLEQINSHVKYAQETQKVRKDEVQEIIKNL